MPYPILSNEFQSSDALHGDFDEAGQPRQEGEAGARGVEGGGNGRKGELQSRSLTWGARVMFKRQFWHPADPGPTFFNHRRRRRISHPPAGGTTLLGSLCPPEGLPRLLLTDRTKLASPVPPKSRHWELHQYIADSADGGARCAAATRDL